MAEEGYFMAIAICCNMLHMTLAQHRNASCSGTVERRFVETVLKVHVMAICRHRLSRMNTAMNKCL